MRLTLAEYCDDAPHELIIEMFTSWNGLKWSFLTRRPNFTRNGMAADFAADPDPRLRWAALFDPTAPPELVEALSHDPNSMVYPRAVSDPRLPLARLHEALGMPRTALAAARNPTLPEEVMHKLLDYISVALAERTMHQPDAAPRSACRRLRISVQTTSETDRERRIPAGQECTLPVSASM